MLLHHSPPLTSRHTYTCYTHTHTHEETKTCHARLLPTTLPSPLIFRRRDFFFLFFFFPPSLYYLSRSLLFLLILRSHQYCRIASVWSGLKFVVLATLPLCQVKRPQQDCSARFVAAATCTRGRRHRSSITTSNASNAPASTPLRPYTAERPCNSTNDANCPCSPTLSDAHHLELGSSVSQRARKYGRSKCTHACAAGSYARNFARSVTNRTFAGSDRIDRPSGSIADSPRGCCACDVLSARASFGDHRRQTAGLPGESMSA
jgi:hypothetical protein